MTIGKPSIFNSGRDSNRSPLGPSDKPSRRRSRAAKGDARSKRASLQRRLTSQTLESRQLLAGPELIGIQPNVGELIAGGTSLDNVPNFGSSRLDVSPNEFVFRFDDQSPIDPDSIGRLLTVGEDGKAPAITITRADSDGGFESAKATTDFGTGGLVLLELRARAPGVSGNDTVVRLTSTDRGSGGAPVTASVATDAETNKPIVTLSLNSNSVRPATMRDVGLEIARVGSPAQPVLQSFEIRGETLTPVGRSIPAGGITLTLDGANAAAATTDLGLGQGTSLRLIANESGPDGRNIAVNITQRNFGASTPPLVTVSGNRINVQINSNPTTGTTVGELVDAINNTPTASRLITARLERGLFTNRVSPTFAGTSGRLLQLVGASDTVVQPGFIGIGNSPNEIVFRFAESLPDDVYQIEVYGEGDRALLNQNGEAFNDGQDFAVQFSLNVAPRVAAVVPEPVRRNLDGSLSPEANVIEVYFTGDVTDSVLNRDFYKLIYTRNTVTPNDDNVVLTPVSVESSPARPNVVRLNFGSVLSRVPDPNNPGGFVDGAARLRIGNDSAVTPTLSNVPLAGDAADTFGAATNINGLDGTIGQSRSVRLTGGRIENVQSFDLQFPGGTDYEGVRNLRPDDPTRLDRTVPLSIWRGFADSLAGITTAYYNFPSSWQGDDPTVAGPLSLDRRYSNLLADRPDQQQRVREVLSLFSEYLGIQFIEIGDTADGGVTPPNDGPLFSLAVGELYGAADSELAPASAVGGVTLDRRPLDNAGNTFAEILPGLNLDLGSQLLVMDFQDFDESIDDEVGGEFFRGAFFGIGQLLGFGYADHLPPPVTQSTGSVLDPDPITPLDPNDPDLLNVPALSSDLRVANERLFPSPADIVNGQYLYRPESNDIDLYKFTLSNGGKLTLTTIAERLAQASSLDTALRLYKLDESTGEYVEVAANDDYFSNDSLIELEVERGTYVVGVSASGNTTYDPIIAGTGIGGTTQGAYELLMTLDTEPANSIVDVAVNGLSNRLDGDADGTPGGDFNYWFNPSDPNTTLYVDSAGGGGLGGTQGSILQPFREIDDAIRVAANRIGSAQPVETIRVVGGGSYQIGRDFRGNPLRDGASLDVPQGVNLIIDAGATFQMSRSRIGVGSTTQAVNRSGGTIQVLGTPDNMVRFLGLTDTPTFSTTDPLLDLDAGPATWGGIDIRGDIDFNDAGKFNFENAAVFLNHIQYADMRHGGGLVRVDGADREIATIELADVRATVMNNRITQGAGAAMAATPDTFAETRFNETRFQTEFTGAAQNFFVSDVRRVGPHINGNTITGNSINGLLVRLNTPTGSTLERLTVNARFDDSDIVHVLTENLLIEGTPGGVTAALAIPSTALVSASILPNTPSTAPSQLGQIPQGTYGYRITFIDANGFESAPSEVTDAFTLGATGRIQLNNLPVVPSSDFSGRRIYRAVNTGTATSPSFNGFRLVGQINGTDVNFVDRVASGSRELSQAIIDDPTKARAGRLDPSLVIDPGTVVKLEGARIDVTFGAHFYAEGTANNPIVITSIRDVRYGAGGTFNTGSVINSAVRPGDWGGVYVGFGGDASFDHAVLAGGGGVTRIEGGFASFNVVEAHQSDLRIANSRFEINADGRLFLNDSGNTVNSPDDPREDRAGRANNASGTIFVRGSQPIITNNEFVAGSGPVMSFDVNSFTWQEQLDYGRSTGLIDADATRGNSGPMIHGNRIDVSGANGDCVTDTTRQSATTADGQVITCGLNGLEVRGGSVATEVVWDDTDIVHIVRNMIEVPNQHIYGGLRLESDARGSLVVKFQSLDANDPDVSFDILRQRQAGIVVGGTLITAADQFGDIAGRIGGSLQIVGQPDFPVILTALSDDTVGAGFTPDGRANIDTDNNGVRLDANGDPIFILTSEIDAEPTPPGLPIGPEYDRTNNDEVDNGTRIDNDIDDNVFGFLETIVTPGAELNTVRVTGQDQNLGVQLANQNYAILYTTFFDIDHIFPNIEPGPLPVRLIDADNVGAPAVATLVSPDRVRSTGVYEVLNRQIRWSVDTFILDNRAVIYNTINLEMVDGGPFRAGFIRDVNLISYFNPDVVDDGNDVLYQLGTPGQADFRLLTLNQDSRVGFSSGGIYENDGRNQVNANYLGWIADTDDALIAPERLELADNIVNFAGITETLFPVVGVPIFDGVTPGTVPLGDNTGAPADIETGLVWRMSNGASSGRVTTFLEWIPSDPANPFDVVLPAPIDGSGSWDGITIREAASDFNVAVAAENEPGNIGGRSANDINATPSSSQYLGELAPSIAAGDDSRRVGLIVDGEISQAGDDDVYSFVAEAGTEVWLDIDRTNGRLDTIVELIDSNGRTLVLSDNSFAEAELLTLARTGTPAQQAMAQQALRNRIGNDGALFPASQVFALGASVVDPSVGRTAFQDQYSTNPKDAGMRLVLPGTSGQRLLYHVRVRSALTAEDLGTMLLTNPNTIGRGATTGSYQLQIRLSEADVFPGTQIRYSDVRFAVNGVQVIGGPLHSPLAGDDFELARFNQTLGTAQRLGLFDTEFIESRITDAQRQFLLDNPGATLDEIRALFNTIYTIDDDGRIIIGRDSNAELLVDLAINNPAGPLGSDRLAKNISGVIDAADDVDWYQFEIRYQSLTADEAQNYLATVLDLDYADGLARGDFALHVFDANGALVLIGGDSNIADDQPAPGTSSSDDLSRGSFGTADPYIGTIELPEGTYFVAVSNQDRVPANLDQFTNAASTNPLLRLEPIDSVRRIAEERFNLDPNADASPGTFGGPVLPILFDDQSIIEHSLDDVILYVNTAAGLFMVNPFTGQNYGLVGGFGDEVNDVAFTANGELFGYTGLQGAETGDNAFEYVRIDSANAALNSINVGGGITTLHSEEVETITLDGAVVENGTQTLEVQSNDGIDVQGISIRGAAGNEFGFLVANRPGNRTGNQEVQYDQNIVYQFNPQTGDIFGPGFGGNFANNQPGVDTNPTNTGAGTTIREIGFIDTDVPLNPDTGLPITGFTQLGLANATSLNAAGVRIPTLYDGDSFTIENITFELDQGYTLIASNPSLIPNGQTLSVTVGTETTVFEFNDNVNRVNAPRVPIAINRTLTATRFIEVIADALRQEGILFNFAGTQLAFTEATLVELSRPAGTNVGGLTLTGDLDVPAGRTRIPLLPTDTATGLAGRIAQIATTAFAGLGNLNFTAEGSSVRLEGGLGSTVIDTTVGNADLTRLIAGGFANRSGLVGGGLANGGIVRGIEEVGGTLYAITDTGGLYEVLPGSLNTNVTDNIGFYVPTATALRGLQFTGLRAGPGSVNGQAYRNLLFGTTAQGDIYAFNTDGVLQPVFSGGRSSIQTGISGLQGLDFSTLDFNLWHYTGNRSSEAGHGQNTLFTRAREGVDGGGSLAFNFENGAFFDRFDTGENPLTTVRQDGTAVEDTFNLPGGARGSVQSNNFSLVGYSRDDQPTLYFSYFLETDGVDNDAIDNDVLGEDRDSLRVYIIDAFGVEHLVATNNQSANSVANNIPIVDEFDDPQRITGSADPNNGNYNDSIDVDVQPLFDNSGSWRQARVPLGAFAGQSNLGIRVEFASGGLAYTGTPELRTVSADQLLGPNVAPLVINGETFTFQSGAALNFPSGQQLAAAYLANPGQLATFTVDGQVYVLTDGTQNVPADQIAINLLAESEIAPAGTLLSDLSAADVATLVREVFDITIAIERLVDSGAELADRYANSNDRDEVFLSGTTYVLADDDLPGDPANNIVRLNLPELFNALNPNQDEPPRLLAGLSEADIALVLADQIGDVDGNVNFTQLVPSNNELQALYLDSDALFVTIIDDIQYVFDDGTIDRNTAITDLINSTNEDVVRIAVDDVGQANLPELLREAVEEELGILPNFNPITVSFNTPENGSNDILATATDLTYPGGSAVIRGTGILGADNAAELDAGNLNRDDVDLVTLTADAGTTLSMDVDSNQFGLQLTVRFFDADGNELSNVVRRVTDDDDGSARVIVSTIVPTTGQYYIGISGPENAAYDPRVAGSGNDAQTTPLYEAVLTVTPVRETTALGRTVEFLGVGSVIGNPTFQIQAVAPSGGTGNVVSISRSDDARGIAEKLRVALADRFLGGNTTLLPIQGSLLKLGNLVVENAGPFTLYNDGFFGDRLRLNGDGGTGTTAVGDRYGDLFGAGFIDGAADNAHAGVFIDDVIIGFAERGEIASNANPIGVNEQFIANPQLQLTNPDESANPTNTGAYQLEIRDASEYVSSNLVPLNQVATDARFRVFDTNDRLDSGTTATVLPAAAIDNGAIFTLADANQSIVFQINIIGTGSTVTGNRVAVNVSPDATAGQVADQIITLINSSQVQSLLNIEVNRANGTVPSNTPGLRDERINFYGNVQLIIDPTGRQVFSSVVNSDLRGDSNRDRVQQGVIMIESNRFLFNSDSGIQLNREAGQEVLGRGVANTTPAILSHPRTLVELNSENLIPGVTVRNNVVAFNSDAGIYISGLDSIDRNSQGSPVVFDRILNNTVIGGNISEGPDLGSQVFASVLFEQGGVSFADSVVGTSVRLGTDVNQEFTDRDAALGAPDSSGLGLEPTTGQTTFSLGSGGTATFVFEDNLLIGDGTSAPDLVIFESGTPERVRVEVSRDGVSFINVGQIFGIDNKIDLDAFGFGPTDQFAFVRLTDLAPAGTFSRDRSAGADIDAIGAISTVPREIYVPGSQGIVVRQNSAPTLLNNIVANLQTGIAVELPQNTLVDNDGDGLFNDLDVDVSSDLTVIGGTTYFRNANNSRTSTFQTNGVSPQLVSPFEQIFVAPTLLIFTPQSGSITIDSGIASLPERVSLASLKRSVGLPVAPLVVPDLDLNGQFRIDDPTVATPSGVGLSPFVDRGAEDRADQDGPRIVLTRPRGDDLFDAAGRSVTRGTIFDAFEIQLIDGIAPAEPAPGVGINDDTVTSDLIRVTRLIEGSDRVEVLQEGSDYRFAYEPADNTIRLTPLAGIWTNNSVFTVEILGNQVSQQERGLTAVLRAREGRFYGDGDITEVGDQRLEVDMGISLSIFAGGLTAVNPTTQISESAIDGQTLTIFDGLISRTFEFDTDPQPDNDPLNIPISLPETANPAVISRLLADAINDSDLQLIATYLRDPADPDDAVPANATGRLQLLGTSAQSELAFVSIPEDSFVRQTNSALDVRLDIEVTPGNAGERFTNFDGQQVTIFDGTTEQTFEFDTNNLPIDPLADPAPILVVIRDDSTPRQIVQALIEQINQTDLNVEVSGASGTFRIAGTLGPISVSSPTDSALITGNSRIGVSAGFGIEVPTVEGEVSPAIADGQTFTITRATDAPVTFELDFDGGLLDDGHLPVTVFDFDFGGSVDLIANAIVAAVGARFPDLTPVNIGGGRVTFGGDEFYSLNVSDSALSAIGFGGQAASVPVVLPLDGVRADALDVLEAKFPGNPVVDLLGSSETGERRNAGQYFAAIEQAFAPEIASGDVVAELIDRRVVLRNIEIVRGESVVSKRVADEVGNPLLFGEAVVIIGNPLDYGDAPAPYATLIEQDGPRHVVVNDLFLGFGVSEDVNGTPNNGDDDDGVELAGSLRPGFRSEIQVIVNGVDVNNDGELDFLTNANGARLPITVPTNRDFIVDVWFDWDRDGLFETTGGELTRFDSRGELGLIIGAGLNPLSINVPTTVTIGDVQARVRLYQPEVLLPGGQRTTLPSTGRAESGEVEDYTFRVTNNPFQNPNRRFDVNGDGNVSPIDALQVINALNTAGGNINLGVSTSVVLPRFPDVNGDGMVSAVDALNVINELNRLSRGGGEPLSGRSASGEPGVSEYAPVTTGVLATGSTIATGHLDPVGGIHARSAVQTVRGGTPGIEATSKTKATPVTSVFDNAAVIGLDDIVDSIATDRDSQDDATETSAVDEVFATLF